RDRLGRDRLARFHARAPRPRLRARAGCTAHVHEHPHHERLRRALRHRLGGPRGAAVQHQDPARRTRDPGQAAALLGPRREGERGPRRARDRSGGAGCERSRRPRHRDRPARTAARGGAPLSELGFDPDALRAKYRAERDKRLRPDGIAQYVELAGGFAHFERDPYVTPGFARAPKSDEIDVALIAAGFGGRLAGARLRQLGVDRIRIIEKGGDVGGTWYW